MPLYTFFLDFKGGIYVSQVRGDSPEKAIKSWAKSLNVKAINGLGERSKQELIHQVKSEIPIPLENVKNTWCCTFLPMGKFLIVHFTQTED